MHIKVNLEPKIINECLALHYRNHPLGRRQLKKLVWIPMVLLALAVYLIYPSFHLGQIEQNFYIGLLYLALSAGYYIYMRKRMLTSGKIVNAALGVNSSFDMEIDAENLKSITSTETLNTSWSDFTEALISNSVVLLYQQNGSFSMYHQSFFQPGDFETFKSWANEQVHPVYRV
ncbi:YcxB family protein [Segetibacter sp. 3557_3]|uniref:YcxB family protein n=1 Tax=Segetibacter sp. 3557_3 TaxID=2547429 RepID=UPI001058F624|nr:YcxB family protein [Segetibacter sp. 3557_3]TDH19806.1 YcxB family protein [Segetibacter sp. 3557_3]